MSENPMPEITREKRDELRELHAEATPGEWSGKWNDGFIHAEGICIAECHGTDDPICDPDGEPSRRDANRAFIVAAHNALPGLLDALDAAENPAPELTREQRKERERLRHKILPRVVNGVDLPPENLTPDEARALFDALDAADQRADATAAELATIHRTIGRGDGHGSLHATADCVISGIVALQERVAEAEKDYAEALGIGGVLRGKLEAAEADAIRFAWATLAYAGSNGDTNGDGVGFGNYDDCCNSSAEEAAEYLAARGLLEHVGGRIWRKVAKPAEGK